MTPDLDEVLKKFEVRKSEEVAAAAAKSELDGQKRKKTVDKLNLIVVPQIDAVARRLLEAGHKVDVRNRLETDPYSSISLELTPQSKTDNSLGVYRISKLTFRCLIPETLTYEESVYSPYGPLESKKDAAVDDVNAEWAMRVLVSFIEKALRYG